MNPVANPASQDTASDPADQPTRRRTAGEDLEATSRAVLAAHEGRTLEAIDSVRWERRGFLRRLTRA